MPGPRAERIVDPTSPAIAVIEPSREEVVLGAFQRAASALELGEVEARGLAIVRRVSGGPAVLAGPGTLHLVLALPAPDALVPCAPAQLVNRYVRPLLRALGRLGATAHYFGRDWVSVAKRPAAWVGFAHHAATGRSVLEALVAVTHPFALPRELDGYPARTVDPFLGKTPATIAELTGKAIDARAAADAILAAYGEAYGALRRGGWSDDELRPIAGDARPPWGALVEEAIGFVGADVRPGTREIGGDFLASEDLVEAARERLEALPAGAGPEALSSAVSSLLGTSGFVVDGVRDPASFAAALAAAHLKDG